MKVAKASDLFLGHVTKCSDNKNAVADPAKVVACVGKEYKTVAGAGVSFDVGVDECSVAEDRKVRICNQQKVFTSFVSIAAITLSLRRSKEKIWF